MWRRRWRRRKLPKPTYPERVLYKSLERQHIPYIREYQVGPYRADAYIPHLNVLIEVDGEYWHSKPAQQIIDKRKNAYYKAKGYGLIRIPAKNLIGDTDRFIRLVESFERNPYGQ
jgi:very-short-patch-repair endonuclease